MDARGARFLDARLSADSGQVVQSERVKPRHAAALALVGWYLMMPPLTKVGPDSYNLPPDTSAPISKWTYSAVDHFDTEEECKTELTNRQSTVEARMRSQNIAGRYGHEFGQTIGEYYSAEIKAARCVRDTDPGIKPK
jgi:uncharacterized caspase-like protein